MTSENDEKRENPVKDVQAEGQERVATLRDMFIAHNTTSTERARKGAVEGLELPRRERKLCASWATALWRSPTPLRPWLRRRAPGGLLY